MKVYLENIQGFYGGHSYTIDEALSIINSKHNGVGKTTLFDCLKFLVDPKALDKDEHKYFVNLRAHECQFSVTINGVTNGFGIQSSGRTMFFRKEEDYDLEISDEPFPNVAEEIGILVINNSMINIFSKEVNLFSTSLSKQDYKIVEAITTHHQTQEALVNTLSSMESTNLTTKSLKADLTLVEGIIANANYYPLVNDLEELLADSSYENTERNLISMLSLLGELNFVPQLEVSSGIELIQDTLDLLNDIHEPVEIELSQTALVYLQDTLAFINSLHVADNIDVSYEALELLPNVSSLLNEIVPVHAENNLEVTTLEYLTIFNNALHDIQIVTPIEVDSELIPALSSICVQLAQIKTNEIRIQQSQKQLDSLREQLSSVRVACPIRSEVYLVNGQCVY